MAGVAMAAITIVLASVLLVCSLSLGIS